MLNVYLMEIWRAMDCGRRGLGVDDGIATAAASASITSTET